MTHDNDDELRSRFKAMASEDSNAAPPFSPPAMRPREPAGWSSARPIAAVAASVVLAVITLLIGMVVGTNTGFASGRVEGDRQRATIAANASGASSQLAALRFEVARARDGLSRSVLAGQAQPSALLAIEAELRTIEASIGRIEADLRPRSGSSMAASSSSSTSSTPTGNNPMRRALAVTCSALAIATPSLAQSSQDQMVARLRQKLDQLQGVPVVDLPQSAVRSSVIFGGPIGVRQVAGGKVMINDGRLRQIKLFDSTLTSFTMVSDSTPGTSTYYGPYGMQLIPYFGDSSLFADFPSQTILLLNGKGDVARALAPPSDPNALGSLLGGFGKTGVDGKGRLIYASRAGTGVMKAFDPSSGRSTVRVTAPPDSSPIVRADLDSRRVDTLDRVKRASFGGQMSVVPRPDGKGDMMKVTINPLRDMDEWAVLSDGTIGIVRGHDYHVDWIHPDGTRSATAKLPFDWKRLTDQDKQKLIDSARAAMNLDAANAAALAALSAPPPDRGDGGGGGRGMRGGGGGAGGGGGRGGRGEITEIAPPSEIPDFYPPLRDGAAIADMDGNLWILPTTSAQSKNGELVYDVVNPKRGLFERVRMPVGRSVLGFGKGGVVYLMSGDRTTGFYVEKTRLSK